MPRHAPRNCRDCSTSRCSPPQAHCCIGGKSIGDDIRRLEAGVHIVSGTPGRVFDMIKRRSLRTR